MLPARHRLRTRDDFSATVRRGRRAGRPTLVVHLLPAAPPVPTAGEPVDRPGPPARVGFVVSRSVGGSVVRNRVVRRLRAQVAARLGRIPAGARMVVRALPPAADATSALLGQDLDAALGRLLDARADEPRRRTPVGAR